MLSKDEKQSLNIELSREEIEYFFKPYPADETEAYEICNDFIKKIGTDRQHCRKMPKMSFTDFLPAGAYRLRRAAVMTVGVLFMGFAVAAMRGSENNDPYRIDAESGEIEVESNNAGGILGGISTGAPVMWRMAVKPTPSIGREQQTVDMDAMENAELSAHGRHDPCIVPRAVPVAEAAAALAIWDALLEDAGQL